jgi:hypothetical protein
MKTYTNVTSKCYSLLYFCAALPFCALCLFITLEVRADGCVTRPGPRCSYTSCPTQFPSEGQYCSKICTINYLDGFGACTSYGGQSEDECASELAHIQVNYYRGTCTATATCNYNPPFEAHFSGTISTDISPCN